MFREMRRKKQIMSEADSIAVLERNTAGVLAVAGDDDYAYAVPLSYVYCDGRIYFHTAKAGHKVEAMKQQEKVSFCVIDEDKIVPKEYTTYFRSVIAFGKAKFLAGDEKMEAVLKLCRKYCPEETDEDIKKEIGGSYDNMEMVEISIDHLSGKEAIEFVNMKK